MKYNNIREGIFRERPNRFIAFVTIDGKTETCHVKNTGRCRELLVPGAKVYLEKSTNPNRKTAYDLIAVEKGKLLINMDSQIPNGAAEEWMRRGNLFPQDALVQREKTYGNSRFDIYAEYGKRRAFVEVKGVTLEEDGIVRFPDAPTARGVKHVMELVECIRDGYEAYLLFVIQMKGVKWFEPNTVTHPEFAQALIEAEKAGVKILAYDCVVTADSIAIDEQVEVRMGGSR